MGTDQQSGGGNRGVDQDVTGDSDEGRRNAEAAPDLAQDADAGETAHPAPADDVGVPSDQEAGRDTA